MEEKVCPSCKEPVIDKHPACPLQCMTAKCKAFMKKPYVDVRLKPVIWVMGGPGSGKGTQCDKIVQKYGYTHLCTGDLLRAEILSDTNRSICIRNIMKRGGLVPTDIVMDLIKQAFKELEPTSKGFLIDGFPRDKNQGLAFEKAICSPSTILYFTAPPAVLTSRLLKRASGSDRIDDNEETIMLRVQNFVQKDKDFFEHYETKLHLIDAEGQPDSIFNKVETYIDPVAAQATLALATEASKLSSAAVTPQKAISSQGTPKHLSPKDSTH